jgi:HEAT repeat protein
MSDIAADTAELIKSLQGDPDWQVRRRCALALARRPVAEEGACDARYQALVGSLSDRDHDVRHAAILALGRLGDRRALDVLCRPRVLDHPETNIRWAAVTAIGELGSLAFANALSRALDDPEWIVRNQALLVMTELIRRVPETTDGEQIKSLIRLLAIRDNEIRGLVVDALARRSTRGLDEMVEALQGQSRVVRAGVAEALGLSRDPRAVAPLIAATRDPVGVVRREAARGLGRLRELQAVEPLIVALGDSDAETCRAAITALAALGSAAVVPLCTALAHATAKVHRRNIILALGRIRDECAVIPLLNNLSSTYYVVRQATITALSAYGEEVVDDLAGMVQVSQVPVDALLQEALEQKSKRLRLRAVRAIGELKNASVLKALKKLMNDPDPDLVSTTQEALSRIGLAAWARHGAVIALGRIGSRKALPTLIRALEDSSEYVRAEAACALAKIWDETGQAPLIAVLGGDEHPWVRREAAAALRSSGSQSREVAAAFQAALADDSWEVRAEAARALGRIDDCSSLPGLLQALEDHSYTVKISAVHALANLERYSAPELFTIAAGADSARREPALQALAEAADRELVAEVKALYECPVAERQQRVEQLRQRWR